MSIFAGALSDRWDKKRAMLVCDLLAAATTVTVLGWITIPVGFLPGGALKQYRWSER